MVEKYLTKTASTISIICWSKLKCQLKKIKLFFTKRKRNQFILQFNCLLLLPLLNCLQDTKKILPYPKYNFKIKKFLNTIKTRRFQKDLYQLITTASLKMSTMIINLKKITLLKIIIIKNIYCNKMKKSKTSHKTN